MRRWDQVTYSSIHTDFSTLIHLNVPQAVTYAPGNPDRKLLFFGGIFSVGHAETFLGRSQACLRILESGKRAKLATTVNRVDVAG